MYQDAKYIIQYCRDSVTRAKNAMQEDENIIRIGSSPMTPAQLLMELWSRVQTLHPDIKFQIVPFENTPENAREILANLGKNIDIVFLMRPCCTCGAVLGWNWSEARSTVLFPFTIDWQQRINYRSQIFMAKISC